MAIRTATASTWPADGGRRLRQLPAASCRLAGATFDNVDLSTASFDNVDLSGARLANINLSGVSIDDARIDG
jgi:uncharacterized protein YjbI with pentapeptide repeats